MYLKFISHIVNNKPSPFLTKGYRQWQYFLFCQCFDLDVLIIKGWICAWTLQTIKIFFNMTMSLIKNEEDFLRKKILVWKHNEIIHNIPYSFKNCSIKWYSWLMKLSFDITTISLSISILPWWHHRYSKSVLNSSFSTIIWRCLFMICYTLISFCVLCKIYPTNKTNEIGHCKTLHNFCLSM